MKIFISYRRDDTSYIAGRLCDRLKAHFGPEQVFRDIETLAPGADFGERITEAMRSCDALVALIGDDWTGAGDPSEPRRIDDSDDWVRLEIADALARGVLVVPVLVENVTMPSAGELPKPIRKLARRNAMELTDLRWDYDVETLIDALEDAVELNPPTPAAGEPARPAPRPHDCGRIVPLPPLLCRVESLPVVGRVAELQSLQAAFESVAAGNRRTVLLAGEPGVGKTRLATEAAQRAHAAGAVVLAGRCDEDLGVPYQPFVEAIRYLVEHTCDCDLAGRLGKYAGELVRLLPELGQRLPGPAGPLSADPETERYRLFDAVAAWVAATSETCPLVLVVDDLHWATKPTVLLLRHVLRAAEPARVLVVGTFRHTEMEGTPLAELLADLRRQPGVVHLRVEGLGQEAVSELVNTAAGPDIDAGQAELAALIHDQTRGNPFFVGEIVRHLAERGAVRAGRWTADSLLELGIPEGVRAVVDQRLSRLAAGTSKTLEAASVIGLDFEIRLLRAVAGEDDEELLSVLEEATAAGLVEDVPGAGVRQRFLHALLRATLYEGISRARRVGLHRRVAEAIESTYGGRLDERLPELAHHFGAAAAGGDAAKALAYAHQAGERSLALLANYEAATYFRQALDLLDGAELDERSCKLRRCELTISLGEAQRRSGDPGHRQTLLEGAALARELGDPERLAQAALMNSRGFFSSAGRVDHDRVRVLQEAIDAYPPVDCAMRARLLANLAVELVFAGDWEHRVALSDDALAMARRVGNVETLVLVLNLRFVALWNAATMSDRLDITAEARRLAEGLDDPTPAFYASVLGAHVALEAGDVDGADELLRSSSHLAVALDQPTLKWFWLLTKVKRELVGANLAECERLAMETLTTGQESGQEDAVLCFTLQLGIIRLQQGRAAEIVGVAEEGIGTASLQGSVPMLGEAMLALMFAHCDREADARRTYESLMANDLRDLPRDFGWLAVVARSAEVCAYLHDTGRAETLYRLLKPYGEQFVDVGPGCLGSTARYLGLMAALAGRTDDAVAHFSYAAEAHARAGAPLWAARVHLEWGRTLIEAGDPAQAGKARELLERALTVARQFGLQRVERLAADLLASSG